CVVSSRRPLALPSFPTRRSSDLWALRVKAATLLHDQGVTDTATAMRPAPVRPMDDATRQSLLAPQFSPHAFIQIDRGTIEIELADRKSTRLNSSHEWLSYAVFCL